MKEIELNHFEVFNYNGDGSHGSHGSIVARASSRITAEKIVNADQYTGIKHVKETLYIVDSVEEFLVLKAQGIRDRALAKLTAEECAALGL